MLISVDLPQPDGPTTVTNSRSAMSRSTPPSAVKVAPFIGKVFTTSRKLILLFIVAPASR
jgi:hypothetical protein